AQLLARGALLIRTGGDDRLGAERARELNRRRADAARAAVDQQPFAALESAALEDVRPHGEERFGKRGGLNGVEPAGDWQALRRRRRAVLGVAAARDERTDAIADLPVGHIAPDADDGSGDLETWNVRCAGRRRIFAFPLRNVGTV